MYSIFYRVSQFVLIASISNKTDVSICSYFSEENLIFLQLEVFSVVYIRIVLLFAILTMHCLLWRPWTCLTIFIASPDSPALKSYYELQTAMKKQLMGMPLRSCFFHLTVWINRDHYMTDFDFNIFLSKIQTKNFQSLIFIISGSSRSLKTWTANENSWHQLSNSSEENKT